MRRFALAALMLLVLVSSASAQSRRERRQMQRQGQNQGWSEGWTVVETPQIVATAPPVSPGPPEVGPTVTPPKPDDFNGSADAMDEVNAKRARKGLPPLQRDPLLCQAAYECARQRAARNIHGHLPESDFSYLPSGAHATVGGAGALEDSWGWETCAYDSMQYRVGGAAWVRGPGGLRFMHFFGR